MKKLTTALAIALCASATVCAQGFSEAKALYSKGEYGKAKTAFAKLLRKSPSSAAYNYWHGLACLKTNDLEAAAGSLEKAAKRKYADSQFVLGRVNTIRYDFDAAVGNFEAYAEQLAKDKGGADERARCDLALRQAKAARMMMLGVERVNVIDSVVMDKADFLSIYRLGEGAGSLHSYAGFFGVQRDSADERVVYETELRNAIVYSDYHDGGLALYRSSRDGDGWAVGRIMPEEITGGGSQNYPYLLSVGLTIYYASAGEGSIGGYDIFVTAYSEYALEAFEVNAIDYLMKPVDPERLGQALDKVQSRMKPQPQSHSSVERIPVVKSGRKVLVPIDQIRYIEAKDDYSCIYTADDRFLSTISLAKLEQKLAPHGFFRVHRGYIVNLEYVEDVEVISSGILQLGVNGIEGKKISVSRRRVVALKRALGL